FHQGEPDSRNLHPETRHNRHRETRPAMSTFLFRLRLRPIAFQIIVAACFLARTAFGAPANASGSGASQAAIPDRPEKLSFPPLVYEPPAPEQYRVALKTGPVAYVVPDRELPLVNIQILVHTGDYLEKDGQEGLANLMGNQLSHGGTQSR